MRVQATAEKELTLEEMYTVVKFSREAKAATANGEKTVIVEMYELLRSNPTEALKMLNELK